MVIDIALSKVARGTIMVAAQKGEAIPEGWALDADGKPTTDAAGLAGTMVPFGDAKGATLAMMVEILAAALVGAHFGFEADSFFSTTGPPPRIGQLILVPRSGRGSAAPTSPAGSRSCSARFWQQDGTRLPGDRRLGAAREAARDGLEVEPASCMPSSAPRRPRDLCLSPSSAAIARPQARGWVWWPVR